MANEFHKDAIELLKADHDKVREAFEEYEQLENNDYTSKQTLIDKICSDITQHAIVEEELFYPAVSKGSEEAREIIYRALNDHTSVKDLIAEIQDLSPKDDKFDLKVQELYEQIELHVYEEESEIFPLADDLEIDLIVLGHYMADRKVELNLEEYHY